VDPDSTSGEAAMAKVARRTRQHPGLVGRTARGTVRLGMLATAVFVGRKTASVGRANDAQETTALRWLVAGSYTHLTLPRNGRV
jgi:hypothetical protein